MRRGKSGKYEEIEERLLTKTLLVFVQLSKYFSFVIIEGNDLSPGEW